MKYTHRQLVALSDPCFEPEDTIKATFVRSGKYRGHWVSSTLTANVGTE